MNSFWYHQELGSIAFSHITRTDLHKMDPRRRADYQGHAQGVLGYRLGSYNDLGGVTHMLTLWAREKMVTVPGWRYRA